MPSLKESLYQLPVDTLREILHINEFDLSRYRNVTTKQHLVTQIENDLTRGRQAYTKALATCNAHHLLCLQGAVSLLASTRVVNWESFLAHMGGERLRGVLEKRVQEMAPKGLLFRIPEGIYVPSGLEDSVPTSLSARKTLQKCLNEYDASTVRIIRNSWDLTSKKDTKTLNIDAITEFLLNDENGAKIRAKLSPKEQEVLDFVSDMEGSFPFDELILKFIGAKPRSYSRWGWQNQWQSGEAENELESLLQKGLLYTVWHNYGYSQMAVIPGDLLQVYRGDRDVSLWLHPPTEPQKWTESAVAQAENKSLLQDITLFLSQISSQEAMRTKDGSIHRNFLKATARLFRYSDEQYINFVFTLCNAAGFIHASEEKPLYVVTTKGISWLHWSELDQRRVLFETWRQGVFWLEMLTEPAIKEGYLREMRRMWVEQIVGARETAIQALLGDKTETAWVIDSVMSLLTFQHPLRFIIVETPIAPTSLLEGLIYDVLYWFGCIELLFEAPNPEASEEENRRKIALLLQLEESERPEPVAYRITPWGRTLLMGEPAPVEAHPQEEKFILQANGEIVGVPYLTPALLYRVNTLTEIPKNGTWQSTPSITKESLRRALDKGETGESIRTFLQNHSRVGISQNIDYLIQEVGGKHGHIHVGIAQFYLQVASPLLLKEIKARKDIKFKIVKELSDTIALLEAEDIQKVVRDLRKAGYLPTSDDKRTGESESIATVKPMAPPAFKKPQPPVAPKSQTSNIDWDKLRKEDGLDWKQVSLSSSGASIPQGAQTNQSIIRYLARQAIQNRMLMEVGVLPEGTTQVVTYQIEPSQISDAVLGGTLSGTTEMKLFYFAEILWLRNLSR